MFRFIRQETGTPTKTAFRFGAFTLRVNELDPLTADFAPNFPPHPMNDPASSLPPTRPKVLFWGHPQTPAERIPL